MLLKKETGPLSCYVSRRLSDRKNFLNTALALLTVLSAVSTFEWDKLRNFTTGWEEVTHSVVFFPRLGDWLCDGEDENVRSLLDVALRRNSQFLRAFGCLERGFVTSESRCADGGPRIPLPAA